MMMTPAARTVSAVLAVLLLALPAAVTASEPPGAETPEALVARMQAASETQDVPEMMACIAPGSRREMALAMVAGTGMMVAFMGMGGGIAGEMGEAMIEGLSGEEATPEQMAEMAKGQAELAAKAAAMQASFEAILDRHGVTEMMEDETPLPDETAARAAALEKRFAKTDDIALMADLMGLMKQLGGSEEAGEIPPPVAVAETVTDYQIDGDRATARSGDETLEFVRVDGRWYLEPGDSLGAAP